MVISYNVQYTTCLLLGVVPALTPSPPALLITLLVSSEKRSSCGQEEEEGFPIYCTVRTFRSPTYSPYSSYLRRVHSTPIKVCRYCTRSTLV